MRHVLKIVIPMTATSVALLVEAVEMRKAEIGNVSAIRYGEFSLGSNVGGTRGVLTGDVTFDVTVDTTTED